MKTSIKHIKEPSLSSMRKYQILLFTISSLLLLTPRFGLTHAAWNIAGNIFASKPVSKQQPYNLSDYISARASGHKDASINLSEGRDILTAYAGEERIKQALQQNTARPLALADGDFDGDGVQDLISSYAGPDGGVITLHRGNIDAIMPNAPEAKQRKAAGEFTNSPFLSPARVFELPLRPDFIGTGDFDADGHLDIVAAARGGNELCLLAGDGKESFVAPKQIKIPGSITALKTGEINRRDGLMDVVVGINGAEGPRALVYEGPKGALRANPETFALRAEATDFAFGQFDGEYPIDLAIAAGNDLLIVRGRDRRLSSSEIKQAEVPEAIMQRRSFSSALRSLATGNFTGSGQTDLSILSDEGTIYLLREGKTEKGRVKKSHGAASLKVETLITGSWSGNAQMINARVSSLPADDLVVIDSVNNQVHIINARSKAQSGAPAIANFAASVDIHVEGEPVAILPMRLNVDALNDLVILRKGQIAPAVVPSATNAIIEVNSIDDSGVDTLRAAIILANSTPGPDTINFAIGTGPQTIILRSPLPAITETVTIDATTQPGFSGTPIIGLDGTNAGTTVNELKINASGCVVRGLAITNFNGNDITITANGNIIAGNSAEIISIANGANNIIGGTVAAARNDLAFIFIDGPATTGNQIRGNFVGVVDILGGANNNVGGATAGERNVISDGVLIRPDTSGNLIQGNFVGTDAAGNNDSGIPLSGDGVFNLDSSNNTIGGTASGQGNLISGGLAGVRLFGGSNNIVQGNLIGTNAAGTAAIPNSDGVIIIDGINNLIGGTTPAARNIISGNALTGIFVAFQGTTGNQFLGNFIGTDITGTSDLGNDDEGILIIGADGNTIGGTTTGARNVISGNNADGIFMSGFTATGNTVQGNLIGTDVTGTTDLGNVGSGIFIEDLASNNSIGGTAAGAGNIISGNDVSGIVISDSGTSNNPVRGNFIGVAANGSTPLPNQQQGVSIINDANGNSILSNVIFSNGQLGIDLNADGVTPNDAGDLDAGANNLQNFPVLTLAGTGGGTTIQGTFNGAQLTLFRLEFFSSASCDSAGNGEGQTFLGSANITTDGGGNANINVTFPISVAPGNVVTSTATDPDGNTSEFSQCVTVILLCSITCSANLTVNASPTQCGTAVNYPAPVASMGCGTVTCAPPSGAFFPVGATDVNCATQTGPTCSFTVTVNDNTPPTISCPADISTTAAPGRHDAIVNYAMATASDACAVANVTCAPPPGSTFPIGFTTVNCSAMDESNNSSVCTFIVTVADNEAPVIRCPNNITVDAPVGQISALVNYSAPTVTDNSPGSVVACLPPSGSAFPLGITTVNCTVADSTGNQANCGFSVTVNGGTPTAKIIIEGNKPAIEFGGDKPVTVRKKPAKNKKSPCGLFTIQNTGFTPLVLTLDSINRIGSEVDSRSITDPKESEFYSLSELNEDGTETLIPVGSTVTITVGGQKNFCLRFDPTIPGVASNTNSLRAQQVVPDLLRSRVTFLLSGGAPVAINVNSNLETTLKLINPDKPKKDAVITLSRSGNEFAVIFSVFDSNGDVNRVKYEFLNASGAVVGDPIEVDLTEVLRRKNLVRGQSFTVIQQFTGANSHAEVTGVRVTVFDGESNVTSSASNVSRAAVIKSLADSRAAIIAPPTVWLKGSAPQ
jgi:hypothetical protein